MFKGIWDKIVKKFIERINWERIAAKVVEAILYEIRDLLDDGKLNDSVPRETKSSGNEKK